MLKDWRKKGVYNKDPHYYEWPWMETVDLHWQKTGCDLMFSILTDVCGVIINFSPVIR